MSTTAQHSTAWVGADLPRKEDPALVRGSIAYVDDLRLPGLLHAAVLRSPHAHARIVAIDTTAAKALPGVHAVLTGPESLEVIGPLARFCAEEVVEHAIAVEKVRYFGEAVAVVAAESRYIAEDALALIEVEYAPLPVVADAEAGMAEGAALVHENLGSNVVYQHAFTFGDVDAEFAAADRVVRRELRWPRATAAPLETNGAVVRFDAASGRMDVWSNTNLLNFGAWVMSATLGVAPHMLNFHPLSVGGSFGSKHFLAKQIGIAGALAKVTGRPVKFMEDRADNLLASDAQAPERAHVAELALDADGTFRSLRVKVVDDYGAYFMLAIAGNTNPLSQIVGPYRIGSVTYDVTAVLTNKNQQGVLRGAGSDVTNWVLERLVDAAADELGVDPVELRRKNLIPPDAFPYKIPTGNFYDSGDYPAVLARALELADLDRWRAEQERARAEGRYIGIGVGLRPAAQHLLRQRVLVPQHRRARPVHDHGGERPDADRPHRRDHRHAVRAVLGQLAGDGHRAAHRGRAGRRPGRGRDRPRPDHARPALGGPRRQPHDGDAVGRGGGRVGEAEGQDLRDRRAPAGGRRSTTSSCATAWCRCRAPTQHVARGHRDGRLLAEGQPPRRDGERPGGQLHLRPAVLHAAQRRPHRPRGVLPDRRARLPRRGRRGGSRRRGRWSS